MPPDGICAKATKPSPTLLHWLFQGSLREIQETYLASPPDEPLYRTARSRYSEDVACTLHALTQTSPRKADSLLALLAETDEPMAADVAKRLRDEDASTWGFAAAILGAMFTMGDDIAKAVPAGLVKAEMLRHHKGNIGAGTRVNVPTDHGSEVLRVVGVLAVLTQPQQVYISLSSERAEELKAKAEEQRLTALFFFPPDMDMLCQQFADLDCSTEGPPPSSDDGFL